MRSTDLTLRIASRRNRVGSFAGALIVVLVLASCGTPDKAGAGEDPGTDHPEDAYGTQAIWEVAEPAAVKPADRAVQAQVQRVDCASGKTGTIVEVDVDYQDERIAIAVRLEPVEGDQSCQGNEQVPYTVELDEPIGQRELVDAACRAKPASGTTWCDDAVRWSPSRQPKSDGGAGNPATEGTTVDGLFFAHHPDQDGGNDALLEGGIVDSDGCLTVSDDAGRITVPAFPLPSTDPTNLQVGDRIALGGGFADIKTVSADVVIPDTCRKAASGEDGLFIAGSLEVWTDSTAATSGPGALQEYLSAEYPRQFGGLYRESGRVIVLWASDLATVPPELAARPDITLKRSQNSEQELERLQRAVNAALSGHGVRADMWLEIQTGTIHVEVVAADETAARKAVATVNSESAVAVTVVDGLAQDD